MSIQVRARPLAATQPEQVADHTVIRADVEALEPRRRPDDARERLPFLLLQDRDTEKLQRPELRGRTYFPDSPAPGLRSLT